MSRLLGALVGAFVVSACATPPTPLPSHLDPSNPEAAEAPPVAVPVLAPSERPTAAPQTAPAPAPSSETKTVFACPMHPEVRSEQPAHCPKCRMKLVQQQPASGEEHSHHGGTP